MKISDYSIRLQRLRLVGPVRSHVVPIRSNYVYGFLKASLYALTQPWEAFRKFSHFLIIIFITLPKELFIKILKCVCDTFFVISLRSSIRFGGFLFWHIVAVSNAFLVGCFPHAHAQLLLGIFPDKFLQMLHHSRRCDQGSLAHGPTVVRSPHAFES